MKYKTKVTERGPGFKRLYQELGGLAVMSLGVQDQKALELYPNTSTTVGEVAAIHELGLGNNVQRSWLSSWMDANEVRLRKEARAALSGVMRGRISRKRAFVQLGEKWEGELKQNIQDGNIEPPISPETAARKGHDIPLLETHKLKNAITYKLRLPRLSDGDARKAASWALRQK